VTSFNFNSYYAHNTTLSVRHLETLKKKFEDENQLLQKCLHSQKKDTWYGTLAAAISSYVISTSSASLFASLGKSIVAPLVGNIIVRSTSGSRHENIADVAKLMRLNNP